MSQKVPDLTNPKIAVKYLNIALKNFNQKDFVLRVLNILQAHGGVKSEFAKKAGFKKSSIPAMRRGKYEITWTEFCGIVHALGGEIRFSAISKNKPAKFKVPKCHLKGRGLTKK